MTTVPEVSVVMANYNGRRYLADAIRSLQSQTLQNWELLFVDDCSTDDSVAQARNFANADARICVVVQPRNLGPAAARNQAIALARGRWLAVFDSDDLMRPQRLECLHRRALADRAEIVADNLLVFSDTKGTPQSFLPRKFVQAPRWIGLVQYIASNCHGSRVPDLGYLKPFFRREALLLSDQRYDEGLRIGEDYDLMARLLAAGLRLRLEPEGLYLYRKHSESTSYRLDGRAISTLISAHDRLTSRLGAAGPDLARALKRRKQTLWSMQRYDRVIELLKAGKNGRALALGALSPRIWPLLSRLVVERARRPRRVRPIPQSICAQER